jgi:hypothetical protein
MYNSNHTNRNRVLSLPRKLAFDYSTHLQSFKAGAMIPGKDFWFV